MRAQVLGEGDVARLVEVAGQVARLQHGAQHRGRIAGIGAQIAVAQIGGRKQRRAAGQIDQHVAAHRRHRCATAPNCKLSREEGAGCGVAVDRQLEGAEIALGRLDRALAAAETR